MYLHGNLTHIGVAATSRHRSFAVSGRIAEYCRVYPGCLAFHAAVFAAREIYGITNSGLLVGKMLSTHVKLLPQRGPVWRFFCSSSQHWGGKLPKKTTQYDTFHIFLTYFGEILLYFWINIWLLYRPYWRLGLGFSWRHKSKHIRKHW